MIVDIALYRGGRRVPRTPDVEDYRSLRASLGAPGDFVWLGLLEPAAEELAQVAEAFGLHPLAVEDAILAHQRPKIERYNDGLFLVLKSLWYVDETDQVETGEINVFLGADFLITVRHGNGVELSNARSDLEDAPDLLAHGPAAALWAVADTLVDGYLDVVNELQTDVDEVETSVFSPSRTQDSARIYTLKRELAEVRRSLHPLREPLRSFASGTSHPVPEELRPFFRDVHDHLIEASENAEQLELLLSSAFDAHLAQISVQQNEDMRKISAGAALVVVPTFIAGVYGMNFRHMPELDWAWGYPMAIALMAASVSGLWILFKRSGWL